MDEHTRKPGAGPGPARETSEHARETARSMADQAKQEATSTTHELRERGRKTAERQRSAAAERLDGVAQALRAAGDSGGQHEDWLGRGATSIADQVERAARHLHDHDVGSLVHEVEDFARRRPEVFLGTAAMAGVLAGRFLRSSRDDSPRTRRTTQPSPGQPGATGSRPMSGTGPTSPSTGTGTGTGTGPFPTGPEGRS